MWAYIFRRLVYNIPVYLGILLLLMAALRVHDPVYSYLGKVATQQEYDQLAARMGLDQPFIVQYGRFLGEIVTLDFSTHSWARPGVTVGSMLADAVVPSLMLTVPALVLTFLISVCIGLISAYFRGRPIDRILVIGAVIGMSISFLVYIVLGQYFGAYKLNETLGIQLFAIEGYEPGLRNWVHYCMLPVLISVIVALGYDTRYYRAVIVEESSADYITTARAKGAAEGKILFVHMLKNAMISIVTRVMITLPFLITGSILLEYYFNIPGMGRTLLSAITVKDFPVIQAFTGIFGAFFIASNILTDVVYALVDPRVRLS